MQGFKRCRDVLRRFLAEATPIRSSLKEAYKSLLSFFFRGLALLSVATEEVLAPGGEARGEGGLPEAPDFFR